MKVSVLFRYAFSMWTIATQTLMAEALLKLAEKMDYFFSPPKNPHCSNLFRKR